MHQELTCNSISSVGTLEEPPAITGSFTVNAVLAFGIVLSILLAPVRLGEWQVLRPTLLVFLPCAAYLLLRNFTMLSAYLRTWHGVATGALFALLALGHLLGNDSIEGFDTEDYNVLPLESLLSMPLAFVCGIVLGQKPDARQGIAAALGLGLCIHIASIAGTQSSTSYRSFQRAAGILEDPNILLLHIVPVFFLWRGLLKSSAARWLAMALVPALLWATLHTLSRAGLVAFGLGLAALMAASLLLSRSGSERRTILATVLALPFLLGLLLWKTPEFLQERLDAYTTRMSERTALTGSLLEDRLMWWREIERHRFSDHLLNPAGMGYKQFQPGNGILPHNTFVDVYIISGPLGFLLYVLLFWRAFRKTMRASFRRSEDGSCFETVHLFAFCLAQFLLLISLSVLTWKVNWLLFGIASGFITKQETEMCCR